MAPAFMSWLYWRPSWLTVGLLFLQMLPMASSPMLLIVKSSKVENEGEILSVIRDFAPGYKVDSKSIMKGSASLIVEVRTKRGSQLVNRISEIEGVVTAALMHHEGAVKN